MRWWSEIFESLIASEVSRSEMSINFDRVVSRVNLHQLTLKTLIAASAMERHGEIKFDVSHAIK